MELVLGDNKCHISIDQSNGRNKLGISEIDLSVVVPVYNEGKYISQLVSCLVEQEAKIKYELIIVNNRSTDDTMDVLRSLISIYKDRLPISVLYQPSPGAALSRKTGMDWINYRLDLLPEKKLRHYIAITDSDCILPRDWVQSMYNVLNKDNNSIAVSGNYYADPLYDSYIERELGVYSFFNSAFLLSCKLDKAVGQYRLRAPNAGFEVNCYNVSGGFIQRYSEAGEVLPREGFDLSNRIRQKGFSLQHFDLPVIASPRRRIHEVVNGYDSYHVHGGDGRYIHVSEDITSTLEIYVRKIPREKWLENKYKLWSKVVENCLFTPLRHGVIGPKELAKLHLDTNRAFTLTKGGGLTKVGMEWVEQLVSSELTIGE